MVTSSQKLWRENIEILTNFLFAIGGPPGTALIDYGKSANTIHYLASIENPLLLGCYILSYKVGKSCKNDI